MKVIGIGDNVVDRYSHLRIRYPGGNALNFSVYASLLHAQAAYLGVFGDDAAGRHVQRSLAAHHIDVSRCRQVQGENGYAQLTVVDGERVFIGSNQGGVRKNTPMDFILSDIEYLNSFSLLHTSCYSYLDHLLPALQRLPGRLSYDFSDDFDQTAALSLCRWLDFGFFSCSAMSMDDCRQLLSAAVGAGCRYAIATRGAEGALLHDGENWFFQASRPITPLDTLGAGDAFITAFLLAFIQGRSIVVSLSAAADFAAAICLKAGAFGCGEHY
ncbi:MULTISPECIES: PfkB family carbohydrate kinase [Brenneria]|uniref:Ribokinase n=1 Tax=Brenneria nigrifluens DSM 30175 = ATCC 13028 TaxID=1121120 RepID=A0A2U1USV7_9GAMM|nr:MULTISPECIES: PfkB family carbohydrate kinase [Brenneria]EHD21724.1 PfkB domain protein [Brenneria sp. EniD312]PWC24739.1 ribokinase [Brenneria nigrifluens] [Brenneria nigrifluens DSM 30175 = ATCC 13028]QCR04837.1 ribokinase [Brenneria nigrifluens] [Brenneria nigrifluens DSM 30175 = ATCC 13028]